MGGVFGKRERYACDPGAIQAQSRHNPGTLKLEQAAITVFHWKSKWNGHLNLCLSFSRSQIISDSRQWGSSMQFVHCTLYRCTVVQCRTCTLYNLQSTECTMYTVHYTVYLIISVPLYIMHFSTIYTVHYMLCNVHCIYQNVHCTLYIGHHAMIIVQ